MEFKFIYLFIDSQRPNVINEKGFKSIKQIVKRIN